MLNGGKIFGVGPRVKRDVALKTLQPDVALDRDRLAGVSREAELAALNHPNIAFLQSERWRLVKR